MEGDDNAVNLTLKELLNVSSDWKEVNNLKGQEGGQDGVIDCPDF